MVDVIPVPNTTAPTLRMPLSDRMINISTFLENLSVLSIVPLAGRDISDGTMPVFIIIPVDKELHPASGQFKSFKTFGRIVRTILACTKQRFGIRIVIADTGAAV